MYANLPTMIFLHKNVKCINKNIKLNEIMKENKVRIHFSSAEQIFSMLPGISPTIITQ